RLGAGSRGKRVGFKRRPVRPRRARRAPSGRRPLANLDGTGRRTRFARRSLHRATEMEPRARGIHRTDFQSVARIFVDGTEVRPTPRGRVAKPELDKMK